MPESTDFDRIAREVLPFCLGVKDADDIPKACDLIAEQLRLVWNARGAVDIAAVHTADQQCHSDIGVYDVDQAIRSLDR